MMAVSCADAVLYRNTTIWLGRAGTADVAQMCNGGAITEKAEYVILLVTINLILVYVLACCTVEMGVV